MRRALGKGLAQLIGEQSVGGPNEVPIDAIRPNPHQPRQHFDDDALADLAASIREVGIIQPLVVRQISEGQYELIAGERRWRASRLAGLTHVPVSLRVAGEEASLAMAIIENVQREGISALEAAQAYRRLIDEFGLTQEQVSERVGKSRTAIANTIRLLKLPEDVQEGLRAGAIDEGHARALLSADSPAEQRRLFQRAVTEGLTVREVERAARKEKPARASLRRKPTPPVQPISRFPDPVWTELEEVLSRHFGTPVRLTKTAHGGNLNLEFFGDDDLQRILDVLGVGL